MKNEKCLRSSFALHSHRKFIPSNMEPFKGATYWFSYCTFTPTWMGNGPAINPLSLQYANFCPSVHHGLCT